MYTCHYIKDALPSLFTLDHGHRLEEDAPLDGFGFEIGPFLQGKLLPQFSGEGNLSGPAEFHQRHGVGAPWDESSDGAVAG